ncbi:AMP-binding protein [Streptomyces sp. JH14]|uniref:AMP-binding protein n=1 Tax=Streptomyces sp. JH14 TaxID=2793630 RepID=UPI0023F7346B|nr:AMP-binding protein [Streptomyces sp. JH14]MDF6046141.1 AMP-binding protein [Streptomyces sp. JH14]
MDLSPDGLGARTTPVVLAERAVTEPTRTCLVEAETGARITYAELHADASALADRLEELGVSPGSTVATMLPHSIDTYRIWFALAALDAVEVPIGTRYRGRMLEHILSDSTAQVLIIEAGLLHELQRSPELTAVAARLRAVIVRGERPPGLRLGEASIIGLSELAQQGRLTSSPSPARSHRPAASDLAAVIYTSGTTGTSKGVLVPWGQVHATAMGTFPDGTLNRDKVIYGPFPPNHIGGRLFVCLGIEYGAPTVIRHVFSASAFWTDVERYGCTTVGLVSAMAAILHQAPATEHDAENHLAEVLMVPLVAEHRDFGVRFGVRVCTSFNMTEVSIPLVSDWSVEDWRSCGQVRSGHPGYRVRVVDEHDQPLGPGQVGELVCRTDVPWTLNAGYLGRPDATAEAWRNGWFHTGDAFRYDDHGRFYFVDRAKDAIRRRGENVSSFEVEREVLDHPDVTGCAAIGVPSELSEEDIKVFVVRRAGAEVDEAGLIAHVAAKAASFMVPRYVEFLESLPMTEGTNRVKKAELRDRERRQGAGTPS